MRKSYEYFLTLAKTLHFTRAANQLFISQQALSDQIQRLEKELKELNVQLFIRKPKLTLTPAGKLLERTLYDIQRLEGNLYAQIGDLSNANIGTINVGMHSGRMNVLFPTVLETFYSRYPKVNIHLISEQTRNYKQLLDEGQIDFFLGINAQISGELTFDFIAREPMYLVIHTRALEKSLGPTFRQALPKLRQGADLRYFLDVPFIFASEISQGQTSINQYLMRKECYLNTAIVLNDYTIQYKLLPTIGGACFCYKMLIRLSNSTISHCRKMTAVMCFPSLILISI